MENRPPSHRRGWIVVVQRRSGYPAGPATWWSGAFDMASSNAWAADLNGDGAADLLVAQDVSVT